MDAEVLRLLGNLCQVGTVTQTKSTEGLSLAKVKIGNRETDFFPVASQSNSFKKHFTPIRVQEQVMVFCPFGEANVGFILRSIFNKKCKEPNGSSNTREIVEYEDGTTIFYDTQSKELNINAVGLIKIVCANAEVTADTVTVTSTTTHDGNVQINGSLTVKDLINGQGGLSISGGNGASVDGDITTTGTITDAKGDLTNHPHSCSDGATAQART